MNDNIGDRFKRYEDAYRIYLPRRLPIIIRVDGKAFHRLTSTMSKPIDKQFVECMNRVGLKLCEEIQGSCIAYIQSDEISILINNEQTYQTEAWFGNNLQKMVSVSAGTASAAFAAAASSRLAYNCLAIFDARAFVLPPSEIVNYFIWRQQDWTRNSILNLASTKYNANQMHGLNTSELQEKLWSEHGINWSNMSLDYKRGRCIVRGVGGWSVDNSIPKFTESREYIERTYEVSNK